MTEATAPVRPPFKVAGLAAVKHLNVRKEGPEDEKILAVDVKLEIKNVDRRLCAYFDDALEAFLWRGDTDALIARNAYLSPVCYANAISEATVNIGTHTFNGCDVKKFTLEAKDGGVFTLGCTVAVYPSAGDVSDLAKIVQDDEHVSIEGPPDLFATGDSGGVILKLGKGSLPIDGEPDERYDEAVAIVREHQKPSISLVQRHLKVGYNRAARLLEEMEKQGVVSAMTGDGQRVLVESA